MNFFVNHKKLVISLSIIFAMILIVIILLFTLFGLKSVELNFKTETSVYLTDESKSQVLENTNIRYGRCVFFSNKTELINELEKENPYLKVINIETIFPNSFKIHCAERESVVAFKQGERYLICDSELKILDITNNLEGNNGLKPILITTDFQFEKPYTIGDFISYLDFDDYKLYDISRNIFIALQMNDRGNSEAKATFETIEFLLEERDVYTAEYKVALKIKDVNGLDIKILDVENDLELKFQKYFSVFSQINPMEYTKKELLIYEDNETKKIKVAAIEKN